MGWVGLGWVGLGWVGCPIQDDGDRRDAGIFRDVICRSNLYGAAHARGEQWSWSARLESVAYSFHVTAYIPPSLEQPAHPAHRQPSGCGADATDDDLPLYSVQDSKKER